MRLIKAIFLTLTLSSSAAFAVTVGGDEAYDLLFRTGTLDKIDRSSELIYNRVVTNKLRPDAAIRDTGDIALTFQDDADEMVHLQFRQDDKHRAMGIFPAAVGNPMIMVFYERTIRDMAEATGGSPYYIRNRVKEALVQPAEMTDGTETFGGETISAKTVQLYPFANDPNNDRMQGFGDLVLSVTVSPDVPGWYLRLVAEAGPGDDPTYRSEMRFDAVQEGTK